MAPIPPRMTPHLRIARPVRDLERSARLYREGLGMDELDRFQDHEGFDGVMLGWPGAAFHLELTFSRAHPVPPSPTHEDLLVFYVPESGTWIARSAAMARAGFRPVEPFNAYWKRFGQTFEDPDGYRVVIQRAAWP